jgi:TRAP-type C4-dicarboxylate transport system permease small subunit
MIWIKTLNTLLLKMSGFGVMVSMAVIAIVMPYEVLARYVASNIAPWSGEAATYSLVWASMLGAAVGLRKGYQVGMTAVLEKLPKKTARMIQAIGYLWSLFFLGVMVYFGFEQTILNYHQVSPGMGVKMAVPYAALPAGFLVMLLVTVEDFLRFLGFEAKGSAEGDGVC